jgi:hypothetical protein
VVKIKPLEKEKFKVQVREGAIHGEKSFNRRPKG